MRIIFAGTPKNAADSLKALHNSGVEIVGVLTRTDAPFGRKRELTPSPVALAANELGIKVIKSNSFDASTLAEIEQLDADLGVVIAYGAFVNQKGLDLLPKGWINVHYSLLPQYRGAAPVQHALLNGEEITGVSVFRLDEGMDTGPILLSVPTRIEPEENSSRLLDRLTDLGVTALLETLPAIAAGIEKVKDQPTTGATLAPKILRRDAFVNWSATAKKISDFIRAMNPEPMAWTLVGEDSVRILSAREHLGASQWLPLGKVQLIDGRVLVGSADSLLELLEVQPSGKNPMAAIDWFNGQQDKDSVAFTR